MYEAHVFYVRSKYFVCLFKTADGLRWCSPPMASRLKPWYDSARLSSPTCRTIGGCVSVVSQLSDRPLACVDGGQRTGQWMVDRRQCGESDSHRFTWGVGPAAPDQPISGPWRSLTPLGIPSLPFRCVASWGRRCTCCPCIQVFSSNTKYPSTSKQDKKDKR
jgi:hypothetical protein